MFTNFNEYFVHVCLYECFFLFCVCGGGVGEGVLGIRR